MSLFSSSPDDPAPPARSDQNSSLFDDDQPSGAKGSSSLFDDEAAEGDSPWSMPTPKKAGRSDTVKTLLPANDVPESYIDAFDALRDTEYKAEGGKIKVSGARKVFEGSGIDATEENRIVKLVTGGQESPLGRSEFNVLLALVSLSQEGEEVSLDSVDERRESELSSAASASAPSNTDCPNCRSSRIIPTLHKSNEDIEGLRKPRRHLTKTPSA